MSLSVANLDDGKYKDLVTDKEYTVSSNKVTVTLTNNACVLVNTEKSVSTTPEIEVGNYDELYATTQSIPVTCKNATKVTYSINDGNAIELTGNAIVLDSSITNGKVTVKITAKNDTGAVSRTINLVKSATLANKSLVITDMDTTANYYIWGWTDSANSKWYSLEYDGKMAGVDLGNATNFIVVKFAKSVTTPDWSKKVSQTNDLSLSKKVWMFSELIFE